MLNTKQVPELKPGVNIFGYVFAEHGVGEEVRKLVQIARHAQLDFAVVPYIETYSRQEARIDDLGTAESVYDVNIICVNADTVPKFVRHIGPELLEGRYNIGVWAWEVEEVPDEMARSARFLDEIWAISGFSAKAIAQSVFFPAVAAQRGCCQRCHRFGVQFLLCDLGAACRNPADRHSTGLSVT